MQINIYMLDVRIPLYLQNIQYLHVHWNPIQCRIQLILRCSPYYGGIRWFHNLSNLVNGYAP